MSAHTLFFTCPSAPTRSVRLGEGTNRKISVTAARKNVTASTRIGKAAPFESDPRLALSGPVSVPLLCEHRQGDERCGDGRRQDACQRPHGLHHTIGARQAFLRHQHRIRGVERRAVKRAQKGHQHDDDQQHPQLQAAA